MEPTPTPEPSTPQPTPTETPTQTPLPTPTPTIVVEPSLAPVAPVITPEPTIEPTVEPSPAPTPTAPNLEPNLVSQEIINDAQADGVLTSEEKVLIANALVSEYADTSIPFEAFEESGLDYEDLPPEQPVTLENGVIILAEIADAIEIFDSVEEVLATIFSDPAKAFTALTSAGADMTPESRETSQGVVVSAVIVAQIAQVRKIN